MKVATYEGIVENGQIKFSEAPRLPEHAKVYVVVAGVEEISGSHMRSPRLAQSERAGDFAKEVIEEPGNAVVR